jgi:hypothetical protein
MKYLVPIDRLERQIYFIRGHRVILDRDLAFLYRVPTGHLNRAVKRNILRFPGDFMFRLTKVEYENLRCQIGILDNRRHAIYRPYVFTQEGVAMLSSVLHSDRAVLVNVQIMRAFVRLRELLATHKDLARKLEELEKKYDTQFKAVFDAIRELMKPPRKPKLAPFPWSRDSAGISGHVTS